MTRRVEPSGPTASRLLTGRGAIASRSKASAYRPIGKFSEWSSVSVSMIALLFEALGVTRLATAPRATFFQRGPDLHRIRDARHHYGTLGALSGENVAETAGVLPAAVAQTLLWRRHSCVRSTDRSVCATHRQECLCHQEDPLAAYTTETITPRYHDAIESWQKKNFPELKFLQDNWTKFYPTQTPYQLFAKVGKLNSDQILHGRMAGQPRYENAGDMVGNMFYTARDIIRAQASTELGSIQQHRLTLEEAPTDAMKMAVLRIMAEELR